MFRSSIYVVALLVAFESYAAAEERDIRSSFAESQILDILFNGALDKELDIVAEQKEQLRAIHRDRQTAIRDGLRAIQEARMKRTPDAAPHSLIDVKSDIDRAALGSVIKVLLPHQVRRWKQIQ